MRDPLGRILLQSGLVKPAQLEEAIQSQVIYGGKLGTNLLELGYIGLGGLSKVLAQKHSCQTINPFQLKPINRDLLKLVGKKLAVKYQVIPLALDADGKTVDLLMSDPSDVAAIDAVKFAVGKRVKPFVSPEVVVLTLIEKYFGVEREYRYKQLAARVLKPKAPQGEAAKQAQAKSAPSPGHPVIKGLDFNSNEDLSSEEEFSKLLFAYNRPRDADEEAAQTPTPQPSAPLDFTPPPAQAPIPPAPPPQPRQAAPAPGPAETVVESPPVKQELPVEPKEPTPPPEPEEEEEEIIEELPEALTLQEAMQRLQEVGERDELSRAVLAFALSYFKRAAIFITRGGVAMGWDGMGESVTRRAVQSIMLPLNSPSIFKTVHDSCSFYLGAIPQTPINERFLKLIGGQKPRSVFLIPVLVGGRVVNILYGDNGDGADAPTDISELLILAPKIPQAFESIIKRKKQEAKEQR